MAWSRELIGVHYPSDSECGRIFARQLVNFLMESETFRNDLEEAKKELVKKSKYK